MSKEHNVTRAGLREDDLTTVGRSRHVIATIPECNILSLIALGSLAVLHRSRRPASKRRGYLPFLSDAPRGEDV